MKFFMNQRLILLLILALGCGARLPGLTSKSLWYDEAVSASSLNFSLREILARKAESTSVHPPLYFLALKGWSDLAGRSEAGLRSLSFVFGLLTILGMYALGGSLGRLYRCSEVQSRAVGLWAAFVTAMHPLQILSSQQVRGYSMGTALFAWSNWALLRAVLIRGRSASVAWGLWSVLSALFCYTHNVGVFSVAAQCIFVVCYIASCRHRERGAVSSPVSVESRHEVTADIPTSQEHFRATMARGMIALCLVVGLYGLPWGARLLSQSTTVRTTTSISKPLKLNAIPREIHRSVVSSWAKKHSGPRTNAWCSTALLGAMFIWLGIRQSWPHRYLLLTGTIPLALLIAFSAVSNRSILHTRYLTFVHLTWIAAFSFLLFAGRWNAERKLLGATVILNAVCLLVFSWSELGPGHQPGMRGATAYALKQLGPNELMIARERHVFFGMNYYAGQENQVSTLLASTRDPTTLRGGEALSTNDLVTPEGLVSREASGVWIFTTSAYSDPQRADFEIPDSWMLVDEKVFAQDYFWESAISVRHYRTVDVESATRTISLSDGK